MKPEAQRVAIAEVCGLTRHPNADWKRHGLHVWFKGDERCKFPNYLKDRNPMIEAIKTLDHSERIDFLCELGNFGITGEWAILTADCDALAEAFLRVKKLWKDSTPE